MKRLFCLILVACFITCGSSAEAAETWANDLRTLFQNNGAVIYELNIRTFNARDLNGNGIIDDGTKEERGSFLNATKRLDELVIMGINTIHVMPITPVGKIKANGTAGSLYAISDFRSLNPQLADKNSKLSLEDQFQYFVDECHKRKIRVVIDLPSCGSYDLYLKRPDMFKKDKNGQGIVPLDWTDVRLFDENSQEVYNQYKHLIDMLISFDVDGVRADVATIKTEKFWKNLIDYTRKQNPQFMFLAEASNAWTTPPSKSSVFTTYDKLLAAGFDGYYGAFFELKNWNTAAPLIKEVKRNTALNKQQKAVIGSFATHDELSPVVQKGEKFSQMIVWLNSTLPLNPYYVDGFPTGDNYNYKLANKKALKSYTDDDYYFLHRGKLDIFNFSRMPYGSNGRILKDLVYANKFRQAYKNIIQSGDFIPLKTFNPSILAYERTFGDDKIVVIANMDFKREFDAKVLVPHINSKMDSMPIRLNNYVPEIKRGRINIHLEPADINVLVFQKSLQK